MKRFIVRLWLPDKPGALGRVANAVGSVGASLTGIDILEQSGGWAIDELVIEAVDAPNASDKLVAALTLVDGVNVEDVRESTGELVDPRVDALESAAELVEQTKREKVLVVLVERARHDMNADWAAVMAIGAGEPLVSSGDAPAAGWMHAFLAGSRSSEALVAGHVGPDDIAWSELESMNAALLVGRTGRPFRARERRQLGALTRIADRRLSDLSE